jgi:hypothetical protein
MFAAVQGHLIGMKTEHILYIKEVDHEHLLRQSLQVIAEFSVDLLQRSAKLLLMRPVADRTL